MFRDDLKITRWMFSLSLLTKAFIFSILFHVLIFTVLAVGNKYGWWEYSFMPKLAKSILGETPKWMKEQKQVEIESVEMQFVEVDPSMSVSEAPADTKFYSSENSIASDPATGDSENPEIQGAQTKVVKSADTPSEEPEPKPLQPSVSPPAEQESAPSEEPQPAPEPAPEPEVEPEAEPAPEPEADDMAAASADVEINIPGKEKQSQKETVETADAQAVGKEGDTRPRTLAEARRQKGIISGKSMQQEGGTKRYSIASSFDARATPFGEYDAGIIAAVQKHWFDLLELNDFTRNRTGKVVLTFKLHYDGSISDMEVRDSSVDYLLALICQKAVLDPAPYPEWPSDMRRAIGGNSRDVRFTFYYN